MAEYHNDTCNRIISNHENSKFTRNIAKLFQKTLITKLINQLKIIESRKKNLRHYDCTKMYSQKASQYTFEFKYLKIKHIKEIYNYACFNKNIQYYYGYSEDYSFMKSLNNHAYRLKNEMNDIYLKYFIEKKGIQSSFIEKKKIKKSMIVLQTFINKYLFYKYFIIYVLGKNILPVEIIRTCYHYIY
jgi:hypothetical protein